MFPSSFPTKIFNGSLIIHGHSIISAHYTLLKILILVIADEAYKCFRFE
jgi:hypothetical protein